MFMWDDFHEIGHLYSWVHPNNGNFSWAAPKDLGRVYEYLRNWGFQNTYWKVIELGGPRGYSMFLHEHVELLYYKDTGLNPLILTEQLKGYIPCHARGLLAEHRFLQTLATNLGLSIPLRALVECNPHADPPTPGWDDDWSILRSAMPEVCLAAEDCVNSKKDTEAAIDFYRRLGFEKVIPYA